MNKTILLTGATDGIGLEAAKRLVSKGHRVLLHGRNPDKLAGVEQTLSSLAGGGEVESYVADLSRLGDVEALANSETAKHTRLDVLINNAGVLKTPETITDEGLDVRFAVNTIAPYLLTQRLLALMDASGRVINLSSAAQAPVDPDALAGRIRLSEDFESYAQSKLAITMWSHTMAMALGESGPAVIAVNPGSLLGTKMVTVGFGLAGKDIGIGADILVRAALSDEFKTATGQYFDNDSGQFAAPHPDALDPVKSAAVEQEIKAVLATITH